MTAPSAWRAILPVSRTSLRPPQFISCRAILNIVYLSSSETRRRPGLGGRAGAPIGGLRVKAKRRRTGIIPPRRQAFKSDRAPFPGRKAGPVASPAQTEPLDQGVVAAMIVGLEI